MLVRRDARQDLAFRAGVNLITHGMDSFQKALSDHSVFALECFFLALQLARMGRLSDYGEALDQGRRGGQVSTDRKPRCRAPRVRSRGRTVSSVIDEFHRYLPQAV